MIKRRVLAREAQFAFEAISIDGGLLSPEWLSKVAQLQAGTQSETDYRIPKGLNLRDEIGRYWRIAQAHWADFKSGREAKADPKAVSERFVLALLRDAFGFTSLTAVAPVILEDRSYPMGHTALRGRVPVVIAPADNGLDAIASAFGDGSRKRSAFGLAQEYLNAQEDALWGIVSDGHSFRVLRDNASLTRPAWIEADLQRIFTEERYADFAVLWLLCQETRFGREGQPVTECALEAWRDAGREEGTRAREHLRRGVEEALIAFGQGFFSHPENQLLRTNLQKGTLPVRDYFSELLRLVYRLIFLLTVEERGLLHPNGAGDAAKAFYTNGYGMRRLRERSVKRSAHDRFSDLWEATKVVFRGLAGGEPHLGLPALAGIFAISQCPALDGAKLENRALLLAMFKLAWLREDSSLSRVNWRDMGPEELGSVYESLLELVPQITQDGRQFAFAKGEETKGNARKTTGSYYTPDSLVQVLLDSALEPVIADTITKNPSNPVGALLDLSIVDPACGSGHFLLAAARRLAAHVASLQADGTPSAAEYRHALRQVVGRCIFGVDLNPMAVELCKVALWMEAVEPGLPLTFLNSHIQQGNALLGATPELMQKGIPDAAWEHIEGDDKKSASALKKRNKAEAGGQRTLDFVEERNSEIESEAVTRAVANLDSTSDAKLEELAKKEARWGDILGSPEYCHQKFVADAWCAAFVWPKQPGDLAAAAPTNELWRRLRDGQGTAPMLTAKTVSELAEQYRFFHWNLQFPQVFAKGGFDVVLGNPPWERTSFEAIPWFSTRDPAIASAPTTARRQALIDALPTTEPALWAEYVATSRSVAATEVFYNASKLYPLSVSGRTNTFALFTERAFHIVAQDGRIGVVVPSALATDIPYAEFWHHIVSSRGLISMLDFENRGRFFPSVHRSYKFSLFTFSPRPRADGIGAIGFFLESVIEARSPERLMRVNQTELALLNPETGLLPPCRSERDFKLLMEMHRRGIPLSSRATPWVGLTSSATSEDWRPLTTLETPLSSELSMWEAKCIHQFNHRFATYAGVGPQERKNGNPLRFVEHENPGLSIAPRYAVPQQLVLNHVSHRQGFMSAACGYRDVARSTDERTLISAIIPISGFMQPLNGISTSDAREMLILTACLNSFAMDFACRQKTPGTHVNVTICRQLPLPPGLDANVQLAGHEIASWIFDRALELTYTAWDIEPFAREIGYEGSPFRWDPERRFLIRCELDAAFFHLYGLSREDTDYVMDTFPIVCKNDKKAHGEYRTKRVILEIYDALTKATQTGKAYQTLLDPLPASPGASHGTFSPEGTPKNYAEALLIGLLFTLIGRSGDAGIPTGALSRALLWLEDLNHAKAWLEDASFTDFERIRNSDALLAEGVVSGQALKLLDALETAKAVTRDVNGIVRLRTGGTIPNWLPQTPTLTKLANVMHGGLERAEQGSSATPAIETVPIEMDKRV